MNRPQHPPRILVVGDVMLDLYTWGNVERVSPEAPIPVLSAEREEVRPGGAASVAMLARHLEAEVTLLGVVGEDPESQILMRVLAEHQVDGSHLRSVSDRPTTCKHRYIGRAAGRHPHQMLRVDRESTASISLNAIESLLSSFESELANCQAVLVADYAKGTCTPELLRKIVTRCRARNIPVLVDPARGVDGHCYRGATLATPNRIEAEQLALEAVSAPLNSARVAARLRSELELEAVIITLDRDGLVVADSEGVQHLPTTPRDVYDITGAGDMVLAMCGYGTAIGWPFREVAALANIAAGLEVERFGVDPIEWPEIESERTQRQQGKICTLEEAVAFAVRVRRSGKQIVFTNGCFDLLHAGHLHTIEESAAQGDVLIVAINSDASVRRVKGDGRPVISAVQRAQIIAALACVDRVPIFDDVTPNQLLEMIRPDILVKGGSTREIIGREIVESYGGRIHHSSLVPDLSTTGLIKAIGGAQVSAWSNDSEVPSCG